MEGYVLEWLNLFGRWVHLITGIAWIGASFYFVWLDNHLEKPADAAARERGVGGELWAVHGGGFYNAQKYTNGVAGDAGQPALVQVGGLHHADHRSAFLLALLYWYQAELYTDRSERRWRCPNRSPS